VLKPSDLAERSDFRQGPLNISPGRRLVEGPDGKLHVEPLVMRVFLTLLDAGGAVVTRETLFDECWAGVVIGDDSLNRSITMVRRIASATCPGIFEIENIPRTGYRLSGELLSFQPEVAIAQPGDEAPADAGPTGIPAPWRRWSAVRPGVVVALVVLFVVALFYFGFIRDQARAEPASIAVLPFRNLGTGDPYFAEGIGEEILGQLAREPQFRVAGSSSSSQFGENPNVNEVARRLDVDYVLEGSVRRQGDQVRVNAGLVRASDGMRLWSDSYDGKLDDIFAIQRDIGGAIAGALQRKLVRAPTLSGPLVTKGEAYDLYLTARSLLRTRNRRIGPTAADLLRDALRIDPGYAPAWASLAEATQFQGALGDRETVIAALRKARAYARHAIALAPNLAEAHRALGFTLAYGDPEGVAHLHRAAALEPNDAENQLGLAAALNATGEFERELAAYRRAHELEPLWFRTIGGWTMARAARGDRTGAEAFARRKTPDTAANLQNLLGRIAWAYGDYSEAARHWMIVARSGSPRWSHTAERTLHDATHSVGVRTGALVDVADPPFTRGDWRVWTDAAPAPAEWQKRNRDVVAAEVYRKHNLVAAKLMLNSGRWRELVATFDGPIGLFGLHPSRRVRFDQPLEIPIVALALRQAGRGSEADRLLREAESAVQVAYRRGPVPFHFDVEAAAVFAVQGRKNAALKSLERAFQRGWRQNSGTSLHNIADEPAFRSLHGEPRFQRLQGRIADHYARERREVEQVLRAQKVAFTSTPT
jgi:TolB-like protein/DNA-binding winged helix-turn-helix (wHTH) protein/tetratricopeptide (TPR) repeat protein